MYFIQQYIYQWETGIREISEFSIFRISLLEVENYLKELQKSHTVLIECVYFALTRIKYFQYCSFEDLRTNYEKSIVQQILHDLSVFPFFSTYTFILL